MIRRQFLALFAPATTVEVWLFLAADCPLANRYIPTLNRLAAEFQPQGASFQVVLASQPPADWQRSYALELPFLIDKTGRLRQKARATRSPEAVVWSNGTLAYRGRIDDRYAAWGKERPSPTRQDLREAITLALAGRPTPTPWPRPIGCYL
ncbi:MAG: hypothetical protein NW208_08595 [Bryobacter sp.]|nr:hypothetical protein [Bryobacter sp.]